MIGRLAIASLATLLLSGCLSGGKAALEVATEPVEVRQLTTFEKSCRAAEIAHDAFVESVRQGVVKVSETKRLYEARTYFVTSEVCTLPPDQATPARIALRTAEAYARLKIIERSAQAGKGD